MSFLNWWRFADRSLTLASIVSVFIISLGFVFVMTVDSHGMEETGLKIFAVELFDITPPPPHKSSTPDTTVKLLSSKSRDLYSTLGSERLNELTSHEDTLKCEIRLQIFTVKRNPSDEDIYYEGSTYIYRLRLSEAPVADLTVGLSITQTGGETKRNVTLDKTELSFSTSNWMTFQEVNLHAINDKIVHSNLSDKSSFTFTASSPGLCKERVHKFSVLESSQRPLAIYTNASLQGHQIFETIFEIIY